MGFIILNGFNTLALFLLITGQNIKRESGRKVQIGNISAAKVGRFYYLYIERHVR